MCMAAHIQFELSTQVLQEAACTDTAFAHTSMKPSLPLCWGPSSMTQKTVVKH